ncbi:MAG: DUF3987 domain-containing protein [Bacteroidales bacterium]|nr:DUF3987 domain-containing protein [Candidatus Liminaster caballi]
MKFQQILQSKHAPKMPSLMEPGMEFILLLSGLVSKEMREAVIASIYPAICSLVRNTRFVYQSNEVLGLCGMLGCLVGVSGIGKGELTRLSKIVTRRLRQHDDETLQKYLAYQKQYEKQKGTNKTKEECPDLYYLAPPSNCTGPAFTKNAMACEKAGNYTFYVNIPEIEMLNSLCGGHKKISETLRGIFDEEKLGALRATADGVTGNPTLRVNINASTTPGEARKFFRNDMHNGTWNRFMCVYKEQGERSGKIPVQGILDDEKQQQIDEYLKRLSAYEGTHRIAELDNVIARLSNDMAEYANLTDSNEFFTLSHRTLIIGYKVGCLLWLLNDCRWTPAMAKHVEWLVAMDLWSKYQVYGDKISENEFSAIDDSIKAGPKNLLDNMPKDSFSLTEFEEMCRQHQTKTEAKGLLKNYKKRRYIEYCRQTGLYTKTPRYLKMIGR